MKTNITIFISCPFSPYPASVTDTLPAVLPLPAQCMKSNKFFYCGTPFISGNLTVNAQFSFIHPIKHLWGLTEWNVNGLACIPGWICALYAGAAFQLYNYHHEWCLISACLPQMPTGPLRNNKMSCLSTNAKPLSMGWLSLWWRMVTWSTFLTDIQETLVCALCCNVGTK